MVIEYVVSAASAARPTTFHRRSTKPSDMPAIPSKPGAMIEAPTTAMTCNAGGAPIAAAVMMPPSAMSTSELPEMRAWLRRFCSISSQSISS
jgi:hypothetical protein